MTAVNSLEGVAVLVTRATGQGRELADRIRALGGEPLLVPAIEIQAFADQDVAAGLAKMDGYDYAIFVSPNAARIAMASAARLGRLPTRVKLAAVGSGTAAALSDAGLRGVLLPKQGADSEALFRELASEARPNRRFLIVRGQGGREWLAERLRANGVQVDYLECYRRVKPKAHLDALLSRWQHGDRMACTATSVQIVENLFEMAGTVARPYLERTPFFVAHPRIARAAFGCGVNTLIVAGDGDSSLALALDTWHGRRRPAPSTG
ncbi:MAG: uroporphyrinogen-III synthase [Burkholderiales bacterium]